MPLIGSMRNFFGNKNKEWAYVQSRKQKCVSSSSFKPPQRVKFDPKLVHDSPAVKHHPKSALDCIRIGEFNIPFVIPSKLVFGRLNKDLGNQSSGPQDPNSGACSLRFSSDDVQNSNSPTPTDSQACAKGLWPGHVAHFSRSTWRCKVCFKLDHKARWC